MKQATYSNKIMLGNEARIMLRDESGSDLMRYKYRSTRTSVGNKVPPPIPTAPSPSRSVPVTGNISKQLNHSPLVGLSSPLLAKADRAS